VFTDGTRSVLVMWRGGASGTAFMSLFLDQFLAEGPRDINWQLADSENRWIAGVRTVPSGLAPSRVVGDSDYPWMLRIVSTTPAQGGNGTTLIAMMAAMLVFLWGAMYFMARAIRREAAVARLQSDFVAAVSHEFRTPLTTIRQMTEMLTIGRVPSEERRQTYYSVLTSEAARLQRLVETLLNFGRMEAGAARYRLEDVDLAALVRRVVAEIEPSAREAGQRIGTSGLESDVRVRADGNALALVVRNLVENALKYSPGQPLIRVELRLSEGQVSVLVIDQGIGVPRHEQQQIFDTFVRGRAAIEGNVGGTGVGLAMVRQIATAHLGHVTVESEVGKGSTFTLVLPLITSQLPMAKAQATPDAAPTQMVQS
jgi:signal transduction histidine kinase